MNEEDREKNDQRASSMVPRRTSALVLLILATAIGSCSGQEYRGCGKVHSMEDAKKGEWPWNVAMMLVEPGSQKYRCGGSLISKRFLVTSARCVTFASTTRPFQLNNLKILLGARNLQNSLGGPNLQTFELEEIILYDKFNPSGTAYDLALVKLNGSAVFNDFVHPICLWEEDTHISNVISRIGTISSYEVQSGAFTNPQADLKVEPLEVCQRAHPAFLVGFTLANTLCAGQSEGALTCPGQTGAGLYLTKSNKPEIWQLRALKSTALYNHGVGADCKSTDYVLFADVAQYIDWIKSKVGNELETSADASGAAKPAENSQNAAEEMKKQEEARKRQEEEKRKQEEERKRQEEEKRKQEEDKKKQEEEKRKQQQSPDWEQGQVWDTVTESKKPVVATNNKVDVNNELEQNLKEHCGRLPLKVVPLIRHGQNTSIEDWPWHLAIYRLIGPDLLYSCGGTLLSSRLVITAAHCLTEAGSKEPIPPYQIQMSLGINKLREWNPDIQIHFASDLIVHPNYNETTFSNDIGLVRLLRKAQFSKTIWPICLWDNGDDIAALYGKLGTVVGWGVTEKDQYSNQLQMAQFPVISVTTCLATDRLFFSTYITRHNFCAGNLNGTTACSGDSGGGMFFQPEDKQGVWHLRGLISVGAVNPGTRSCHQSHYILLTDVAPYLDWIRSKMT